MKRTSGILLALIVALSFLPVLASAEDPGPSAVTVGDGGQYENLAQALDAASPGELTVELVSDTVEPSDDLIVPGGKGITRLIVGSQGGYELGCNALLANGVPLEWNSGKVNWLFGGALNTVVPDSSLTIRGGSIQWVFGGGKATDPDAQVGVSGTASIVFDAAVMEDYSLDDNWALGGSYIWTSGGESSVIESAGKASIVIKNGTQMQRHVMGGSYQHGVGKVSEIGSIEIKVKDSVIEGSIYGTGISEHGKASAGSVDIRVENSELRIFGTGDDADGGGIEAAGAAFNSGESADVTEKATIYVKDSILDGVTCGGSAGSGKTMKPKSPSRIAPG